MFNEGDKRWAKAWGVSLDDPPEPRPGTHDGCAAKWMEERTGREKAEACARSAWDETEKAEEAAEKEYFRKTLWRLAAVATWIVLAVRLLAH